MTIVILICEAETDVYNKVFLFRALS